jgi:hypothetical protein
VALEAKAMMALRVCLCGLLVLVLGGCPYDRLYSPRLKNNMDSPVEMRIVLTDGTVIDDGAELAPGVGLVWGYPPERIATITLLVGGKAVDELDAERIAAMLNCTADPRDVTWYIEAEGLRPSTPCRQLPVNSR